MSKICAHAVVCNCDRKMLGPVLALEVLAMPVGAVQSVDPLRPECTRTSMKTNNEAMN